METMIIYPKSKAQVSALETIFKEMKIPFEKARTSVSPYNPEFVAKIKRGEKAAKEGRGLKVNMENLWK